MPIFMDRHDVSEFVTAENVAQLHQEDLKIQHQFGCRGITYWFDDNRKTAFCLIEAPNAKAIEEMHRQAHGEVPNSIIEVEATLVESFLGRLEDPKKPQEAELHIINESAFRTIMCITLNQLEVKQNDAQQSAWLQNYGNAVSNLLTKYEGRLVKRTDNHFLISFKSVSNAVHAAQEIHLLFKDAGKKTINNTTSLKVGLNAGVPVTQKQSIFEDTVKLAERMCKAVKGEIIISSVVKELYNSENATPLQEGKHLFTLSKTDEQFLSLLMDYTESVWSNTNLKVDDFNKPVGCSHSQLYRKMILLTGKSPNTFLKEYRLNEALNLLDKNANNISAIAFDTGFSSPSYFSKCFQKKYGCLPSDYLPARMR